MRDMDANPSDILPYPLQNALTRPMRNAGGRAGDIDVLSLWAGQGAPMARREAPPSWCAGWPLRPPQPRPGANPGPISGRAMRRAAAASPHGLSLIVKRLFHSLPNRL